MKPLSERMYETTTGTYTNPTIQDVVPVSFVRGWIDEVSQLEAENEALQEKVLAWIVIGIGFRVKLDAMLEEQL